MTVGPTRSLAAEDRERVGAFDVVSGEEHPDAGEDENDGADAFPAEEPDDPLEDGVVPGAVEREVGGMTVVLTEGLDGSFDTLLHFRRDLSPQLF
jgi:hypothetical protein